MIKKLKHKVCFVITFIIIYYLWVSAHVYHKYEYSWFSVDDGKYEIDIVFYPRDYRRYEIEGRVYTEVSTTYNLMVKFSGEEIEKIDSLFVNKFEMKNTEQNLLLEVYKTPKQVIVSEKYKRISYSFERITIPKEHYNDLEVFLNYDIKYKNGTTENFILKGELKTNFKWSFSWDVFDMIMSV